MLVVKKFLKSTSLRGIFMKSIKEHVMKKKKSTDFKNDSTEIGLPFHSISMNLEK